MNYPKKSRSLCGEKNGVNNSDALLGCFGVSDWLLLASSGVELIALFALSCLGSEGRNNVRDLMAADPDDGSGVYIHHFE